MTRKCFPGIARQSGTDLPGHLTHTAPLDPAFDMSQRPSSFQFSIQPYLLANSVPSFIFSSVSNVLCYGQSDYVLLVLGG